jgi:cytidylate kinase
MKVITISRLLYSGGQTIGQQVAEELGYHFVTKELIEKIMDQYGMVEFDQVYESSPGFLDRMDHFQEDLIDFLRRVIKAIAVHGNVVILGRGSFAVFPDYSDVLNVRLWAPLDERVNRYMKDRNLPSRLEAMEEVMRKDKIRKVFVERWFHGHPDRTNAFDLVINTAKTTQESAVRMIVDSARIKKDLVLDNHKTLSTLDIDPILMKTIEETLDT